MTKAHLIDADDPLREGVPLQAACGMHFFNPRFVFWFNADTHDFAESLNRVNTCAKCLDLEMEKRYVYGLVEGGEDVRADD